MSFITFEIQSLSAKYFGAESEVLRGINLEVRPGDWLLLVGPNGCGKSTLLRAATGDPNVVLSEGKIEWKVELAGAQKSDDVTVGPRTALQSDPANSRSLAIVPQDVADSLFPALSVTENLVLAAIDGSIRFHMKGVKHHREEALKFAEMCFVGLLDFRDSLVSELSGGWRAVLALAMALRRRPSILLIDEVSAALDEKNSALFWRSLRQWAGMNVIEKPAVVFISHQVLTAREYANRVVFMRDGAIVGNLESKDLKNLNSTSFLEKYRKICW